MPPQPLTIFEIQKYYQNEPNLIVFILETICLKNKGCGLCNKP